MKDKSSMQSSTGQRGKGPSFQADPKVIKRLHRLEKHMRENKLRHTFADQLGEAQESDELNSKKEARKLARRVPAVGGPGQGGAQAGLLPLLECAP